MKERIVIIFIAVTLGLLATTVAFFLYESAKPATIVETKEPQKISKLAPTSAEIALLITEPKNESITTKRSITVKGETKPTNTIIISSNEEDVTVSPTADGTFAATVTIDAGVNKLIITAIDPDGNSQKETRIVSFTAEEF